MCIGLSILAGGFKLPNLLKMRKRIFRHEHGAIIPPYCFLVDKDPFLRIRGKRHRTETTIPNRIGDFKIVGRSVIPNHQSRVLRVDSGLISVSC